MRVRDFADRMSDEYTSLYEQDTTGIKGGDFERFGAFADNHLDFMRALTKARGMDPISSDREIGVFLNTFDKLAAMPEPSPAAQEKDDFSAGVCDPADGLCYSWIAQLALNVSVGNADAHAKNYSLMFSPDGIRLSPMYDVLTTTFWPWVSAELPMPAR